jgi:hypothetical protein
MAKSKASKKSETHIIPDDVKRLLELIISEIHSPVDTQILYSQIPSTTDCTSALSEFLLAKDRAQRREAYIQTEPRWFRKYGWFMARVVMIYGILAIIFSLLTRNARVDAVTAVLLGAAFYYALLVTLSNWRYRDKSKKRQALIDFEGRKYQKEIINIATSLMSQYKIDAIHYPISQPKSEAGLEYREDKYYIPLPLD